MDEQRFWQIIDMFDWNKTGDDDAVMKPAVRALAQMDVGDIKKFEDILAAKLYAIDTRKHCRACFKSRWGRYDEDSVSGDEFLYKRCVVVANGQGFYDTVLKKPKKFPRGLEFESLLSLAGMAYELKTGDAFDHVSPLSYESFENQAGW